MKISFLFAWYDLWIGFFWDKKKRWLYILPLPMVGLILKFGDESTYEPEQKETLEQRDRRVMLLKDYPPQR